jgi:hypothetical protein
MVRLLALALLAVGQGANAQPAEAADCPPPMAAPSAEQLAQAQHEARDRGFLWRIRRGDHTSYLFGTLHVGRLAWVMPGPQLARALRDSDTLAVEIDPTDPATSGGLLAAAPGADHGLPPDLAARLARARAAVCMGELLTDAHPLLQATTILLLDGRREGLEPAYGQELMLIGAARALGHRVVALETAQAQRAALIPNDAGQARQSLASALDQIESAQARRVLRRTAEVWAESRWQDLQAWRDWCECAERPVDQAQLRRMLDDRNPAMAERIDALHRQGRRVLAAVGALHMVGPGGLPALLTQRGYLVERIAFAPM